MTNPTHQPPDRPTETTLQVRSAFQAAIILLVPSIIVGLFFFYLAIQDPTWQLYVAAVSALVYATLIGPSIWLIQRGRSKLGIGLVIGGFLVVNLIGAALIAKIGLIMGLSVILIVSAIAALTLSQKGANRAIIASIVVGIMVELLAVFPNPYQLPVPEPLSFLLVVVSVVIVAYIFFIARQFANYTLRTKLIIAFLAVALIPLGALAFVNNFNTQALLTSGANQTLFGAASQTAASLDTFIKTNLDGIRAESLAPVLVKYLNLPADRRLDSLEEAEVAATLRSFSLKEQIYITSYALLDSQGVNVFNTSGVGVQQNESNEDYFQSPLETGLPYVSPVKFSQTSDEAALYFSAPIRDAAGEFIGLLRVRYNAAILQQFMVQSTRLANPETFGALFDENHLYLAHGAAPETIFKLVAPLDPNHVAALQAAGHLPNQPQQELSLNSLDFEQNLASGEQFFTVRDVAAGDRVDQVAVTTMKTRPWVVAFFEPQEVFLAPAEAQTRNTLLLAALITVLVAASAIGMGQILTRPITHLTTMAQQVAAGDLEIQAPVESQDEIGQLATTFNSMTGQLRDLIGSLEDRVRAKAAELTLSMEVGQRAAAIRNLDELLPTITELIRERFDLYHVQLYFVDDIDQNLILRAATGEAGKKQLARGHTLPINPDSINGIVAAEGLSVVVSNTETNSIFVPDPLLPETRSELSAPLIVEERVIGVLDLQASQPNAFTEDELTVFEAMATQLAISIDSAQQWAVAQAAQRKSEAAISQLTRESWSSKLAPQKAGLGFVYDLSSVTPLERQALKAQKEEVSVPVAVQDEPIGYLAIEKPADQAWSEDEQSLVEVVAQQLAHKAENLRLFEDTQQRATREQITRQITDKIRASGNIETALNIAAEELNRALGTARTVIDLKLGPEAGQTDSNVEDATSPRRTVNVK